MKKTTCFKISIAFFSFVVSISIGTIIIQFLFHKKCDNFYLWPPKNVFSFLPDSNIFPRIKGKSEFKVKVNNIGVRGDDYFYNRKLYIWTFGGSTTECLYLDQKESWPYLLQNLLNNKGFDVWVGNCSKRGLNGYDNFVQLKVHKKYYNNYKTDVFVFLIGINDFLASLSGKYNFYNRDDYSEFKRIYSEIPDSIKTFFDRLEIFSLLNKAKDKIFIRMQDKKGILYAKMRKWRLGAPKINELPDLEYPFY